MKRGRLYVGLIACLAMVVVAGVRTSIGQGYSDPVIVRRDVSHNAIELKRTLDVRLTQRKTGRSQHYRWAVAIPEGGAVEIECHEWVQIDFYGISLPGFPRNSFRRRIPVDHSEDGSSESYQFAIGWSSSN